MLRPVENGGDSRGRCNRLNNAPSSAFFKRRQPFTGCRWAAIFNGTGGQSFLRSYKRKAGCAALGTDRRKKVIQYRFVDRFDLTVDEARRRRQCCSGSFSYHKTRPGRTEAPATAVCNPTFVAGKVMSQIKYADEVIGLHRRHRRPVPKLGMLQLAPGQGANG